jgi:ABC-type uncharacterized transport system ATPase subunit
VTILGIGDLLERQVRALSLGERMRAGLAMNLVYRPSILFLDEPTIGLDVSAAVQTRAFLRQYLAQTKATMLLTSHYMTDVAELCPRVVLINHGANLYDGDLTRLTDRVRHDKLIEIRLTPGASPPSDLPAQPLNGHFQLSVCRDEVPAVVGRLLAEGTVLDLSVKEAPLDVLIAEIYRESGQLVS